MNKKSIDIIPKISREIHIKYNNKINSINYERFKLKVQEIYKKKQNY